MAQADMEVDPRGPAAVEQAAVVELHEVLVIAATDAVLVCDVGHKRVLIPRSLVLPGSDVRRHGERGKLVIPRSLAASWELV